MKAYRPLFTREVITIEVVGNIVLPLILASPLVIWTWRVLGSESSIFWRFVSVIPPSALMLFSLTYLVRIQWKMWVRKQRWATYFQTRNTLAIKIPFQPISFVKRQDCVGFMPGGNRLVLGDGTVYELPGVPAGDVQELSRGEEILKSWWPEFDIERVRARRKRKLPDRGVIIVTVVAFVLVQSSLLRVLEYNEVSVAGGAVNAWLIAPVYILARSMLRRYYEFTFMLPQEQVQKLDDSRQK